MRCVDLPTEGMSGFNERGQEWSLGVDLLTENRCGSSDTGQAVNTPTVNSLHRHRFYIII